MTLHASLISLALAAALTSACVPEGLPYPPDDFDATPAPEDSAVVITTDSGSDSAKPPVDSGFPVDDFIWAHSADQLYRVDPEDYAVTLVGPFVWPTFIDSMTDLAIGGGGTLFGIGQRLYRVNPVTVLCTEVGDPSGSFNSLGYVPWDATNPGSPRILVLGGGAALWEVDPNTANTTWLGNLSYTFSGDITALPGVGTFGTVQFGVTDRLVALDVAGAEATLVGDIGHNNVYGLAAWKGQMIGFASGGEILSIDTSTGAGTVIGTTSVPWWGAAYPGG